MKKFKMDGKVVLVTGASSGIGRGCATLLAESGAAVFVVARREERLQELVKELEALGASAGYAVCDVGSEEGCKSAVDACIQKFGRIDALVNAAGIGGAPGDFDMEFDTDNFERVIKINLASVFYMTKYACPEFEKIGSGSIINISSGAALHSGGAVAYTASKGGVKSMTRMLGNYLGKKHIRVNCIYPGLVRSEMIDGVIKQNKAAFDMVAERTPLGRIGEPEDIAYCVLYLASDASSWVTGQDFVIDGGDSC